jgi:hypothetical protein
MTYIQLLGLINEMMKTIAFITLIGMFSCQAETRTTDNNLNENQISIVSDTSFLSGEEMNGLQLDIRFVNDSLEIRIKNISDSTIKVCSHINKQDLDWYSIIVTNQNGESRIIHIGELGRTGSQMNTQSLNSQESFSHKIDLLYWSEHERNNKEKLLLGKYKVTVIYEANDCFYPSKEYWNGKITSGPIEWEIE